MEALTCWSAVFPVRESSAARRDRKAPAEGRGSARLSCVDLAAVAAFTAAGLSLVNVAISARLASRGAREQWRRDQERPIVARCLTLSDDALGEWWDDSVAKQVLTARLSGYQIMINGHALSHRSPSRLRCLPTRSRGRDGASEAKRGRTTWTVGDH